MIRRVKKTGVFMKKLIISTFLLMLFTNLAWADQCSTLPNEKALKAKEIISNFIKTHEVAVIDLYCEACMDKIPKALVADTVNLKNFQVKGFKEILINEKSIDLAYVYINGENLASMIDCKTIGVDQFL